MNSVIRLAASESLRRCGAALGEGGGFIMRDVVTHLEPAGGELLRRLRVFDVAIRDDLRIQVDHLEGVKVDLELDHSYEQAPDTKKVGKSKTPKEMYYLFFL